MSGSDFILATRIRLHAPVLSNVSQCQRRRADGTHCGLELDIYGVHALSCKCGGQLIRRHDAMCSSLANAITCLPDITVQTEVVTPGASNPLSAPRLDLAVTDASGTRFLDVAIASPFNVSAGGREGAAATTQAKAKKRKYPHLTIIPAVLEQHGKACHDLIRYIKQIAPQDLLDRTLWISDLWRTLSATLQQNNAQMIRSAGGDWDTLNL